MVMLAKVPVFEPILVEPCSECGNYEGMYYTVLTNRERQVLALVAQGHRNKTVAGNLGITESTVKNHMTSIMRKTGRRDRTGAVLTAIEQGWIKKVEDD